MVLKSFTKRLCIFIVRWRVTSQKLAKLSFPVFNRKVKKNMLTIFSLFFEKMKVYGLHGLTSSFFANLQKTFHFWTFLKMSKNKNLSAFYIFLKNDFPRIPSFEKCMSINGHIPLEPWKKWESVFLTFIKHCPYLI